MYLNPNDSQSAIKILNTLLTKTQDELDEAKQSAVVTNRTVKSLDATVNGTIELDPMGQPIPLRDKSGETIYDDYGEPIFKRVGDGIVMTKAKVSELEADNVRINNTLTTYGATIENANIQDLVVGKINGSVIRDGTLIAKALSNEAIITASGIKVYYDAEEPSVTQSTITLDDGTTKVVYIDDNGHVMKDGDTWYKTVIADTDEDKTVLHIWNETQWESSDLDGKLIRAETITAQEIAGESINAGHIEGGTLTLGTLDPSLQRSINDIDGKVDSTNGSGQMSWDSGALRIDASDGSNFYETEISGDGINFRYGSSIDYARSPEGVVAKINQQYMEINKTIVFTEMQIGNWSWAINPISGHLQVKWNGGA